MATFHSLRVASIRRETADAVVVTFDVPAALEPAYRFQAGQHVTLRRMLDGVEERYGADGYGPSMYIRDPDGNVVELKGPPQRPALNAG